MHGPLTGKITLKPQVKNTNNFNNKDINLLFKIINMLRKLRFLIKEKRLIYLVLISVFIIHAY
jgi:hypothetical protein